MRALLFMCLVIIAQYAHSQESYIRVNSLAYGNNDKKVAILMTSLQSLQIPAGFTVLDGSGRTVMRGTTSSAPSKQWSTRFSRTYSLDFSRLTSPGSYTIRMMIQSKPITSSVFHIMSDLSSVYEQRLSDNLFFFRAQRDGPNVDRTVMRRLPSHLADMSASIYQTPVYNDDDTLIGNLTKMPLPAVDVSGGWFDAGDYIKLVQTASYVEAMMMLTLRDYGSALTSTVRDYLNQEMEHGLEWLLKTWDSKRGILYYQVGIGSGNSAIIADHDVWRLPEADDQMNVKPGDSQYYVKYRPVFSTASNSTRPAPTPLSPNLAGRLSAVFAMCYNNYRFTNILLAGRCLVNAEVIYSRAQVSPPPQQLTTTAPFDYYPEQEWRDDMELGAIELYLATRNTRYLSDAIHWASEYMKQDDQDVINLYDVSGLAHYELSKALSCARLIDLPNVGRLVNKAQYYQGVNDALKRNMKSNIDVGYAQSLVDPFHSAINYSLGIDVVPHTFGYWLQSSLYSELTSSDEYANFEQQQRDWLFGNNAWGSAFAVGTTQVFPHCLQHQVANLVGSLN